MVYRIYVEKKPSLDHEARALLAEISTFLGIEGVEKIRVFNRYDAENITEDFFSVILKEYLVSVTGIKIASGCMTCIFEIVTDIDYTLAIEADGILCT